MLAKFHPQKNLLLQNMLPKICSQENFFQKKFVPHLTPLIFILKNLLPKFFFPRICCQTFLLSIFLLTMKFYLQKSFKIFLLAKFPPHKNLSSKTWSPKFPLKKSCFKKKLFPILPPPPPPNFFFIQKNLLPKYFLPKFAAKHFCSPYYFSQKIASQIFLPKNLCCPNHFVKQLWHLIVQCLRRFYWIFVICLKIVIEQKKHLDLQYVQGIPLQQLPGS